MKEEIIAIRGINLVEDYFIFIDKVQILKQLTMEVNGISSVQASQLFVGLALK